jgi:hypothetical protein
MSVVALLVTACSSGSASPSLTLSLAPSATATATAPALSPTPSPSPVVSSTPFPLPSNACGGFHLKVVNDDLDDITVTINATYSVTVPSGASETLIEFFLPELQPLPWTVVVTNSSGTEIGTERFTSSIDQQLTVSSGELRTEPYDISEDDC